MTAKRPVGRPTEYKPEYAEEVAKLCAAGFTDAQMALYFGVQKSTLNLWKAEHPEFMDSLKKWKDNADEKVVRSLFERASGYEHEVEKPFIDQKTGQIKIAQHIERLPPDPTSMIFWLKNRQPDAWRDRREVEANVKGDIGANPLEQLAASIAALADKLAGDDE